MEEILKKTNVFVLFCNENSSRSNAVEDEWQAAFQLRKADLMKIDKFVRWDYGYGQEVPNGGFRKDVYGSPLYVTNNLSAVSSGTGNYAVYMHKEALAIIAQETMKFDRVPQPLKHQTTYNVTSLWGVKEMRDLFGVAIYTRLA